MLINEYALGNIDIPKQNNKLHMVNGCLLFFSMKWEETSTIPLIPIMWNICVYLKKINKFILSDILVINKIDHTR